MSNIINQIKESKEVVALVAIGLVTMGLMGYINGVLAQEVNTSDFKYSMHITDVIPYYTYQGISKVLSSGADSLEDQEVVRVVIQDSDFYAVYNNGHDNTFVFTGIYQGSF